MYNGTEFAGAFGDLGTLIPFVAAYLSVLKMDANGLLALGPGALERLLVLCDEPNLATTAASRSFGKLQLVEYRGRSGAALASALVEDLTRTTAGRVEPELTSHYKLAYELLGGLGRKDDAQVAFVKFLRCQALLHRERLRPLQMR